MTRWAFEDRERALEEAFFKKKEEELLKGQKKSTHDIEMQKKLEQLVESTTGEHNQELVKHLLQIGVRPESWAAISLIPLIEVAWSDGAIEDEEVEAILDSSHKNGIKKGSEAHLLLERWLGERPGEEFFQTWSEYMHALSSRISHEKWMNLRNDIMERTRLIAECAGSLLGLGSLTPGEEDALAKIEAVFDHSSPESESR